MSDPSVSVIITAYDAAATIGDSVRTALDEAEVAEVIVVDDASMDQTAKAATTAAAGDTRLKVIRIAENAGPAAARNRALAVAVGKYVAVLDADDFILPGRFSHLLAVPDWDMVADNILFVPESASPGDLPPIPAVPQGGPIDIDLTSFVRSNRTIRGSNRQEWGFLKPVIRRDFLNSRGLRYDESLRLGEDYDLYVRMLQHGARFRVIPKVGYAARWRAGSLSSRHRTADLAALEQAAAAHLSAPGMSAEARSALRVHRADLRRRFLLRDFLDRRARLGRAGAVLWALGEPATLIPIARGVLGDKLAARRQATAVTPTRIGRTLIEV